MLALSATAPWVFGEINNCFTGQSQPHPALRDEKGEFGIANGCASPFQGQSLPRNLLSKGNICPVLEHSSAAEHKPRHGQGCSLLFYVRQNSVPALACNKSTAISPQLSQSASISEIFRDFTLISLQ